MNWKGCGRKWCLERLRKTTRNYRSIQTWQRCSWGLHCTMYRSQCTVANCIKILRKSRSEYNVSVALPIRGLDTDYVANVEAIAVYFQTAALHCLTEFYMHCDPANFQWHWHIRIVSRIVPTAAKLLVCPSMPDMFEQFAGQREVTWSSIECWAVRLTTATPWKEITLGTVNCVGQTERT